MRTLPLVSAALIALVFLVAPSLVRLGFLIDPPAVTEPTDVAFSEHRAVGFLHVVPGLAMVALMPVQASATVRRRWPTWHRASGWLFILMSVAVCVTAWVMNMSFPVVGGWLKLSVIDVMIVAELAALGLGIRAILRRDVPAHRRWMVRAIGVVLASGSAGIFVVPFYAAGMLEDGRIADIVVGVGRWLGFLCTVIGVELWLRRGTRMAIARGRD